MIEAPDRLVAVDIGGTHARFVIATFDDDGEITRLLCTYDPATKGGNAPDGRRVKATLHWVSKPHAYLGEVRLYDRLFADEDPSKDFLDALNPDSLEVLTGCKLEPSVGAMEPGTRVQLERIGYFVTDSEDHQPGGPAVLNRTITLKDSWAKLAKKMGVGGK